MKVKIIIIKWLQTYQELLFFSFVINKYYGKRKINNNTENFSLCHWNLNSLPIICEILPVETICKFSQV